MKKWMIVLMLCTPMMGYAQSWMVEKKYEVKDAIPKFNKEYINLQDTIIKEDIQVPMAFKAERLPFFCRYEHLLDQRSTVQVRFRLGSLDYVNQLEQK